MAQSLTPLPGAYTICRLAPGDRVNAPDVSDGLWSLTRTAGETSVVCRAHEAPGHATLDRPWTALRVEGPFDLQGETGILSSVAAPLAERAISIFALATYDTDYVLVPATRAAHARRALTAAGHTVAAPTTTIAPASASDAPAVSRLVWESLLAYRSFAGEFFDPADPATAPDAIAQRYAQPGTRAFTARTDAGDLVGVAGMSATDEPGLGHVWQLFTDPGHHGTGLATALHERLLAAARTDGVERLRLYAADGAVAARAFYAAHGWVASPDGRPGPQGLPVTRYLRDV